MNAAIIFISFIISIPLLSHAMKGDEEESTGNKVALIRTVDNDRLYREKVKKKAIYTDFFSSSHKAPIRYLLPVHSLTATALLCVRGYHGEKKPHGVFKTEEYVDSLTAFIINPQTQKLVCEPETYYPPHHPSSYSFKNEILNRWKHLLKKEYAGYSLYEFMKKNTKTVDIPGLSIPLEKVCGLAYTPQKNMFAALLYDGGSVPSSDVSHECVIFRRVGNESDSFFKKYAVLKSYHGFVDIAWNKSGTIIATQELRYLSIWSPELSHVLIKLDHATWSGAPHGLAWDTNKNILYTGWSSKHSDYELSIHQWDLEEDIQNALNTECNRLTKKIKKISKEWDEKILEE